MAAGSTASCILKQTEKRTHTCKRLQVLGHKTNRGQSEQFISNSSCFITTTTDSSIPAAKIQSVPTLTSCLCEKYAVYECEPLYCMTDCFVVSERAAQVTDDMNAGRMVQYKVPLLTRGFSGYPLCTNTWRKVTSFVWTSTKPLSDTKSREVGGRCGQHVLTTVIPMAEFEVLVFNRAMRQHCITASFKQLQ
ncbi:hypothetical protein EXN66_Car009778 [Channa argus]|uniref:Uncharacterized protein n=1 Tax=Channa argus TaxID=215402 RepID=A0A6G1PV07_CHAAH|nr:hypothetical protein EXN66_Car009778 [Channa argus]